MQPEFLALSIIILLVSVIVHEVMHGFVALKFGDHTAEHAGRLTLNPIPHIDLFGTILLPALLIFTVSPILFGWAKPVPVNLANFSIAVAAAIIYHILNALPQTFPALLGGLLQFTVVINLVLGIFNLFPIPPLDGSKVLLSQLPYNLAKQYQKLERYGFLLLLFLIFIFTTPLFLLLNFLVGLFTK